MSSSCSNEEIVQQLGADTELWCPSQQRTAKPADVLANKVLMLYFSAHWCPPCRNFTPKLKETYKKLKERKGVEDFEVIFFSMDHSEEEYKRYAGEMPWWSMPFKSPHIGKLANLYGAQGIPHLVVLDQNGKVVVPDGVSEVMLDGEGLQFPWRPKPLVDLLPKEYIASDNKTRLPISDLDEKYLMLYFSAHWCPPCRGFTPKLSKAYKTLKENRDDFELLFISSDHDQDAFEAYISEMNFGSIPYEERQAKNNISKRLSIRGIPSLCIFGPRPADGGDRPLINSNVRGFIETGDYVSEFPFEPKPYGDLNKTADNINNLRCVIVFHEGGDDAEQEDLQEALQMAAQNCEDKDMRFYWAISPTGLTKTVRDALKLGAIGENPVMVLLDIPDQGAYYVNESTEITLDSIQTFIKSPGDRKQL